ncbi:MAG: transposase [Opitutaceae bacterium]
MGILHTWGQRLQFHPHVHYLVACAALRRDHTLAVSDGYLFDVKALSRVFRGRYLDAIEQLLQQSRLTFPPGWSRRSVCASLQQASRRNWCVYTKRPVCDPAKLVEYIGRYARKVAVSESRIDSFDSSSITYRWKDYRDGLYQTRRGQRLFFRQAFRPAHPSLRLQAHPLLRILAPRRAQART